MHSSTWTDFARGCGSSPIGRSVKKGNWFSICARGAITSPCRDLGDINVYSCHRSGVGVGVTVGVGVGVKVGVGVGVGVTVGVGVGLPLLEALNEETAMPS